MVETATPVAELAVSLSLPLIKANKVGQAETDQISALQPDLGIVIAYGALLKKPALAAPKNGWLNLHFSVLPAHRGAAPVQHSILSGETETGVRATLNLGHTFGHAIEAGLGFGEWLHGEAVGCGMVMAANLSQRLGLVDEAFVSRFTALIERAGLPIVGPKLGADVYLHHMRVDKKAEAGEIKFVLIDKPGTAIVRGAPDALVAQVIDDCCEK